LEKERPDLVGIATSPGPHAALSVQALEAGAWVLCEKPLCASLRELDRIQEAEQRTGNRCASVFQFRFGTGGQHAKRLIEAEELGRLLVGECMTTWYRGPGYYDRPWRGKWATELGGPTMGHGIHAMDMFLWLMGPWREVRATLGTLDRDIEVEDVSAATVVFETGAIATVLNSVLSPRQETYTRIDGQHGTIEACHLYAYQNHPWRFTGAPHVEEERVAKWRQIPEAVTGNHTAQWGHFLDDHEANRIPLTSGDEARRTLEFLTAIYKSAREDVTVRAGTIGEGDPYYDAIHGGAG
jgi:predicted dehydrogenase